MQAIIFVSLSLIIVLFVIYLGVSAVQKGLKSKQNLNVNNDDTLEENLIENNISDELKKLNDLFQSGAITEEEFKKAKDKILKE
tara:strand:+ start:226 stop:477 length:252 start_codon:yes stop_codon:yes gene_type:complete